MGRRRTILAIAVAAAVAHGGWGVVSPAQAQRLPERGQPGTAGEGELPAAGDGAETMQEVPAINAAADEPAAAPAGVRPDVPGDLKALQAALVHPEARQADRDEAAARLASRSTGETDEILLKALTDGPRDARLAVARAVADDPTPPSAMIPPLGELLRLGAEQRSAALVDAAAQALAGYRRNPQALDALVRFVNDPAQSSDNRARVARALGRVVEPASAGALVSLLRSDRPLLRAAAAEALADLTGIREFGADARRWEQWQRNNEQLAALDPEKWRADLLEAKAAALERLRRRHEALVNAAEDRMFERYQAAAREQRPEVLLAFLNSPHPDERAVGALLVPRAFRNGDPVTEPMYARLVAMVGDSDAGVRREVAVTLRSLNYRPALAALLTQLAQERDVRVRVALAEALAPIEDPAAVPQLAELLRDPSPTVAVAAANAIARTARDLRRANPVLADRVRERLWGIVTNRQFYPTELRVAALEALGAMQEPVVLELSQRILSPQGGDPSATVRQAALRALGALGRGEAGDIIIRSLRGESREPDVRSAALDALGRVGNIAEHGGLLLEYTRREVELNDAVRQRAWEAYQALLPRADAAVLNREKAAFRNDPERLVFVLEELCRKLQQPGQPPDQLANQRVALGEAYMQHKPPRPDKAIPAFRAALDHYVKVGAPEAATTPLVEQLMDAHLESRDYAQATAFAAEIIRLDPRHKDIVGPAIKDEADKLRSRGDTAAALQLIDYALKMDPPLEPRHQKDVRQIRDELEAKPPGQ